MSPRCPICKGDTTWRQEFFLGQGSYYCAKCGVYVAPPDGREEERLRRYIAIALPLVVNALKNSLQPPKPAA